MIDAFEILCMIVGGLKMLLLMLFAAHSYMHSIYLDVLDIGVDRKLYFLFIMRKYLYHNVRKQS